MRLANTRILERAAAYPVAAAIFQLVMSVVMREGETSRSISCCGGHLSTVAALV